MSLGLALDAIPVAVLFAMMPSATGKWDSAYRDIAGCDVWDRERDATLFNGPAPVVAHPPCRMWGRLQHFADGREGERGLALYALACVRRNGGVLEHPEASSLWDMAGLPKPEGGIFSAADQFGGWTLAIRQFDWGHRCEKSTWLYVVGCPPSRVPTIPHRAGEPTHCISDKGIAKGGKPQISNFEREHTPPALAAWLVELARRCVV